MCEILDRLGSLNPCSIGICSLRGIDNAIDNCEGS